MISSSKKHARHQWLTPIILATWEAEIRRTQFKASLGKILVKSPFQPIAEHSGRLLSPQATQDEADIRNITVRGQLQKKTGHGSAALHHSYGRKHKTRRAKVQANLDKM
jgi:hypothetical protein